MVNTASSSVFTWHPPFILDFPPNVALIPPRELSFLWKPERFLNFSQHVWPRPLRRNEWLSRMLLNDFNFKLDSSDALENIIELSPSLLSSERNLLNANDLRRRAANSWATIPIVVSFESEWAGITIANRISFTHRPWPHRRAANLKRVHRSCSSLCSASQTEKQFRRPDRSEKKGDQNNFVCSDVPENTRPSLHSEQSRRGRQKIEWCGTSNRIKQNEMQIRFNFAEEAHLECLSWFLFSNLIHLSLFALSFASSFSFPSTLRLRTN